MHSCRRSRSGGPENGPGDLSRFQLPATNWAGEERLEVERHAFELFKAKLQHRSGGITLMTHVTTHPLFVLVLSFAAMWASARVGRALLRKKYALDNELREDFGIILPASLTLLGLIVGFSFSMATGRYDQRKNYEEAEANAIGTEYVRAKLLPDTEASKVQALLKSYLDQRILFYQAQDQQEVEQIAARVDQLQDQMWDAILPAAKAQPTPITALVVSGMNDVLNSQGYTQSAWWYRIPLGAWELMIATAVVCNLLIGYGSRGGPRASKLLFILPLLISVAFMLIADIDMPRHGLIRVKPQNLTSLADSLRGK